MNGSINRNYKTAYGNAVFLSDDGSVSETAASSKEIQVAGVAFGDATGLIVDYIAGHLSDSSGTERASSGDSVGEVAVITDDSGYYSLCKNIRPRICESVMTDAEKEFLLRRTVLFSVDDDYKDVIVRRLLGSVENLRGVAVVAGGRLIVDAMRFCSERKIDLLVVPSDYSFGKALRFKLDYLKQNCYFAFDDGLFENLQKNKVADAVRSVFAKRILFVEMCVNRLIGLDFDDETVKNLINHSIVECGEYFKNYDYKKLIYAVFLSEKAQAILPFESPVDGISEILRCYDLDVLDGEREYLAYKMLVKIYGVFLSSDTDMVKVPSYALCLDELKNIYPKATIYSPPSYYCNDELLHDLKNRISECEKLGRYVEELTSRIPQGEHIVYLIYGGRKTSVELYPSNVKAQALKLASPICRGDSLLKLIWACGYFEWL